MERIINQISDCEKEIVITLSNDELNPFIEKAYIEAQPKIDLKGFRKGKVPLRLIKQFFGKSLEMDAKQDASNEFFQKIIKDEKIRVLSQPVLKQIDEKNDGTEFIISFETLPDFELNDYRGIQIKEPIHRVDDSEIDHEIEHYRINSGNIIDAEVILSDYYIVEMDYVEMDSSTGLALENATSSETRAFLHNHNIYPSLREKFINLKVGDSFTYFSAPNDLFPPNNHYYVTVKSIKEVIPAELTPEFAEKASNGKFNTVEDLKQEIGFTMQEQWNQRSRQSMEQQIIDNLTGQYDFKVPDSLLKDVLEQMIDDSIKRYEEYTKMKLNLDRNTIGDNLKPRAIDKVKWEIIMTKIMEKEEIKVEDYDLEHFAEAEAAKYGIEKSMVLNMVRENEGIIGEILYKKVMDLILDFAVTEEVDFEDLEPHEHEHYHGHEEDDHEHDHDHNHEEDESDSQEEHNSN